MLRLAVPNLPWVEEWCCQPRAPQITMTSHSNESHLVCVGLSHKTSSVMDRERLARLDDAWFSASVAEIELVDEWAFLSTCNRVELYLAVRGEVPSTIHTLRQVIAEKTQISQGSLANSLSVHEGVNAAHHLLSVTSGLESMVVGESEILGQVSNAYMSAVEKRTIGPLLDALFRAAIRTGKRVRAETPVGSMPASVSSVALDLAADELGDLSRRHVAVIGLGTMGQLALKLLRAQHVRNVTLVNRSQERAQSLADPGWRVRPLCEIPQALAEADLVITATGAPHTVVSAHDLQSATVQRTASRNGSGDRAPLVIIDVALPRDVEPDAAMNPGVILYNLDDLRHGVERAIGERSSAIPAVRRIIDEELAEFQKKQRELEVRPVVIALRTRAESIRERELERTLRYLGDVDPDTVAHLQHLTRALVNKLLHEPTVRIKEMAHEERSGEYMATLRDLFGLDNGSPSL